ncbi:Uncharacterised protein [Enterobacter cloacae]|nr:Uncharacterised protein [Enterobacter cloacae]
MPATKEQRYHQRGNGDNTDVLAHEEQTELHTGIFNVVTVGQFLFGFWLVKRVTVTYRHARDGKGNKPKELRDNVPDVGLVVDDVGHVK